MESPHLEVMPKASVRSTFSLEKNVIEFLKPLHNLDKYFDINLKCVGGEIIRAHRVILAIHSGLLADLVNDEQEFKIGIDVTSMKLIIELMYTGFVTVDDEQRTKFQELVELLELENVTEYFHEPSFGDFLPPMESTTYGDNLVRQMERESRLELMNSKVSTIMSLSDGNRVQVKTASSSARATSSSARATSSSARATSSSSEATSSSSEATSSSSEAMSSSAEALSSSAASSPTSPEEILQHLMDIKDAAYYREKSYALRYWLAVILARHGREKKSLKHLNECLGIEHKSITRYNTFNPAQTLYGVPNRKKCDPTTAEQIVNHLCRGSWPSKTDETYALRFWMAQAIYKWNVIERTLKSLADIFDVSTYKISRGVHNGLAPCDCEYKAAIDGRVKN